MRTQRLPENESKRKTQEKISSLKHQ